MKYTNLILYKTYSDLRAESERTYIGYLWWIIEPIIHMAVYYVVFALIFKRGTKDYVPFLFVGLITWRWLHSTLMNGSYAILSNVNLMRQVYVPKIIFPSVSLLTNSFKFVFVFLILLIFLWFYGFEVSIAYLALPVLLLTEFFLIVALTYLFAAVVPFLPDIRLALDNVLRVLFFISGIFFAGSSIPKRYQFYFYLNPMATLIENYRNILMYNHWPSWESLIVINVISILGIWLGVYLISRFDYEYPKIIG